jgi:lysophospholipase L1-like esterase
MSRSLRRAARAAAGALALAGALVPSAAASGADRYVALGDSYSSGTGTRSYVEASCQRSTRAYPALLAAARSGTSLVHRACAGATTSDVLRDQVSSLTRGTRLVSITVGGNDAGFATVLKECAKPAWASDCAGAVAGAQRYIRGTLPGRLDRVYGEIAARAPAARVAVLGYPRVFNGEDCNAVTFFSPDDERRLNATADLLRDVLRTRAQAHGFAFGDVIPGFVGHAVCDRVEWLNGASTPLGESFHPNAAGHRDGYLPVVRRLLG